MGKQDPKKNMDRNGMQYVVRSVPVQCFTMQLLRDAELVFGNGLTE